MANKQDGQPESPETPQESLVPQANEEETEQELIAEGQQLIRAVQETALMGGELLAAGAFAAAAPVQANEADVSNELEKGGPAFGAFVKAVGLAVAEAQAQLDATLVSTAKALSETQIEVVAIYEQQINDDGEMEKGNVVLQKLPLINYLMPTAYQWSRVFLQADMDVAEFNAANGFNIRGSTSSFNVGARANYGPLGFGASGSVNYGNVSFERQSDSSVSQDSAAGKLHMEATLEPRSEIELPRPFVLQKGPRLKVTAGAREEILGQSPSSGGAAPTVGRRVRLNIELRDQANNALSKQLQFRVGNSLISYTTSSPDGRTDSEGKLELTLTREGAAFDPQRPPESVVVNVWLGLINEQLVITI